MGLELIAFQCSHVVKLSSERGHPNSRSAVIDFYELKNPHRTDNKSFAFTVALLLLDQYSTGSVLCKSQLFVRSVLYRVKALQGL